jgi:hypothetical protein
MMRHPEVSHHGKVKAYRRDTGTLDLAMGARISLCPVPPDVPATSQEKHHD